jgi:hypothetical protein
MRPLNNLIMFHLEDGGFLFCSASHIDEIRGAITSVDGSSLFRSMAWNYRFQGDAKKKD